MSRQTIRLDVTEIAQIAEPAEVVAELVLPDNGAPDVVFVCLPGGGMNRRYFDLPTPDGDAQMSFAEAMGARGHAVVLIDPLGSGESTVPKDCSLLHPDRMADANTSIADHVIAGLKRGDLGPAAPDVRTVGAAHSLGALQTIVQQARHATYDAVCLMGFHVAGLPGQLTDADRAMEPVQTRANLVETARGRFDMTYIDLPHPDGGRAVHTIPALDRVMMTPSLMAMLPDIVAPDAAKISVPVMLVQGDKDLHGDPRRMPAAYKACDEITLLVLPETRHNHFIYPTRTHLFERVARWAECLS